MKIDCLILIIVFTTFICFLKGQQTTKKAPTKFNRFFANISRECLKENHVNPERVMAVYTLGINDREAKCYVACMFLKFNVTDERGYYNEEALEKLMVKPSTSTISPSMKSVIEKCEVDDDKDRCEKAVRFTKCMYAHKNEIQNHNQNNTSMNYRRRPSTMFGPKRHRGPWPRS